MLEKLCTIFRGKSDSTGIQLIRTVLSSLIATVVDLAFYLFIIKFLQVPYYIARPLSYIPAMTVSYYFSIWWIFPHRNVKSLFREYLTFGSVGLVGLGENMILMILFKELLGLHHLLANLSAAMIVFFFNFTMRRFFLFRKKNKG